MSDTVNMVDPEGNARAVPQEEVANALSVGFTHEGEAGRAERIAGEERDRVYGGAGGKIAAGAAAVARGVTLGGSDAVLAAAGLDEDLAALREVNPTISTVGEVGGAVAATFAAPGSALARTPVGAVTRAGARIAKAGEGASTAARVGRVAAGGAFEGAAIGVGEGVSELALSKDPLTLERAASVLSSRALLGGGAGAAGNLVGKGVEKALRKARTAIDDVVARGASGADDVAGRAGGTAEDLAGLDRKALRNARAAELEAIEASRVPVRDELVSDIASLRADVQQTTILTSSKTGIRDLDAAANIARKSNNRLAAMLDDKVGAAKKLRNEYGAETLLSPLRKQEEALLKIQSKEDELRKLFAADTSGKRLAALEKVAETIDRNRALQAKIAETIKPAASSRLQAIDDAVDALSGGGGGKKGFAEQLTTGALFSAGAGATAYLGDKAGLPGGVIGLVAPLAGAKAAGLAGQKLFGRLGQATSSAAARTSKAVAAFADVAAKVTPAAPVLATKVLGAVAFGPTSAKPTSKDKETPSLASLYRARTDEIKAHVAPGSDGQPRMRPAAREKVAAQLAGVRAVDPIAADRLETAAARRIEFYARKMPRRPDLGGITTGPDRWQPSEMEMRSWARTVAAGEDPGAIAERLASGSITPEDAEVMRELYPEQLADLTQQVLEQLPALQAQLPYHRRLALSILTGAPVDPAMHPRILRRLQASFQNEAGSEGGTQAPRARPQFGSVKTHDMTPAQRREEGAAT